jgi:predicted nucleic acid-binding protein
MDLGGRIKATSLMKDYGLDFDNALVAQALRELSMDTIVSYDNNFDSVNWIKRRTPEELL